MSEEFRYKEILADDISLGDRQHITLERLEEILYQKFVLIFFTGTKNNYKTALNTAAKAIMKELKK